MSRKTLSWILLVPFLVLTGYAVMEVGFVGIFAYQLESPAGWQVFADLAISLVLVLTWMIPQARREGRNPWPWVVATLFTGSIAPLAFLALGRSGDSAESTA